MKKYSLVFILVQIVTVFLISWLIAMGLGFLVRNDNIPVSSLTLWLPISLPIFALLYFFGLSNLITGTIAKKTMEKNCRAQNFGKTYTHINKDLGTVGTILKIDEETGRLAYVSYQNPFKFQMANADELTDVISSYIHGPVSTTRYIYFQFRYKGKRTRVPTYTTGNNIMITSNLAKEGIAKADHLRDLILRFQNANCGGKVV
jgi:energy-coupling factor transporter transmembrane protein EcfT